MLHSCPKNPNSKESWKRSSLQYRNLHGNNILILISAGQTYSTVFFFKLKVFMKCALKAIENILASSLVAGRFFGDYYFHFPVISCQHSQPSASLKPCCLQPTSTLKPAEAPDVSHPAHSKHNGTLANRLFQHLVMSETLTGALGNRVTAMTGVQ